MKMLSRWVLAAVSLAVLAAAEPPQNAPYTSTDSSTEERSESIFTTLSDDGPMAGTGARRRLEPLPTASAEELASASIYTPLSHNGPMAGMATRRLEPLPTASAEERASTSIYTTLSSDGPMGGTGQRKLRQY